MLPPHQVVSEIEFDNALAIVSMLKRYTPNTQ
jgi:hypothetical protein